MSFGEPSLLAALLLLPAFAGLTLLRRRGRRRDVIRFTNINVLAGVGPQRRSLRRYAPPSLFLLALATATVAMARPRVPVETTDDRATVILVVDVSPSMQADDVKPTRLVAAEAAVRAFLRHAPKKLRVALVALAGAPQVAVAPTTDHELLLASLPTLGSFSPYGGTAIGDTLAAATRLGRQALRQVERASLDTAAFRSAAAGRKGPVTILFLSDGAQTTGRLSPLQGAAIAKRAGFAVYTVALGAPRGRASIDKTGALPIAAAALPTAEPPDPTTLREVARATGGRFLASRTERNVTSAYRALGSSLGREPGTTEVTSVFLAGAAGLLLAAGLASALWAPRLP